MGQFTVEEKRVLRYYLDNIESGYEDSNYNKCYGWTVASEAYDKNQWVFTLIEEHIIEIIEGRSGYTQSILIDSPEVVKKIIEGLITYNIK